MTVLLVMIVISAAAVTFLGCFFTAVCKESTGRKDRVERISRPPLVEWGRQGSLLQINPDVAQSFGR